VSLFRSIVSDDKLDDRFRLVRDNWTHHSTRMMMDEVFATFQDVDGNFVEQFQSTGFDARTWELYLHAGFTRSGFGVQHVGAAPDFMLTRSGVTAAVEATTCNPPGGGPRPNPSNPTFLSDPEEAEARQRHIAPIRYGSALTSKLKKAYWNLPHVAGKPFVLAIEPFYDAKALALSGSSLAMYLYGRTDVLDVSRPRGIRPEPVDTHTLGPKTIPSGFFQLPESEHVSAAERQLRLPADDNYIAPSSEA